MTIKGTSQKPRVAVFRSNKHLYLQLIDDTQGRILASASDFQMNPVRKGAAELSNGVKSARQVGALLAQKALKLGIIKAVFDRSGYKYHGNVKAAREGAKEAGLQV